MTTQHKPGTGFEVETEIVWSRVLGVLLAFGLLIGSIYWFFGGKDGDAGDSPSSAPELAGGGDAAETGTNSMPAGLPPASVTGAQTLESGSDNAQTPDTEAAAEADLAVPTTTAAPTNPATAVPAAESADPTLPPASSNNAIADPGLSSPPKTPTQPDAAPASTPTDARALPKVATTPSSGGKAGDNYTVRAGETLKSIALQLFGDESKWIYIALGNPSIRPNALAVGKTLRIPDIAAATRHRETEWEKIRKAFSAGKAKAQTITVHPGENLSVLAQKAYGNSGEWRRIAMANRDKVHDPHSIEVGMQLLIPAASD